jgi:hypothetical protein
MDALYVNKNVATPRSFISEVYVSGRFPSGRAFRCKSSLRFVSLRFVAGFPLQSLTHANNLIKNIFNSIYQGTIRWYNLPLTDNMKVRNNGQTALSRQTGFLLLNRITFSTITVRRLKGVRPIKAAITVKRLEASDR